MRIGFLVFSGYNERAVIAFLRVLKRYGVDVFIVANGPDDRILRTAYASDVYFVRPQGVLDSASMVQALDAVSAAADGRRLLLAPSTEGLNRFFLANPELLAQRGITLPLVAEALYQRISDKFSFGDLCRNAGIRVPEDIVDPARCPLPFVAKPLAYELAVPLAPRLILTESDRVALLSSPELPKYYFQQFVEGRSLYLLLHFSGNGEVCAFSQENLVQQPDGKSIIAALPSDFHLSPEADKYVGMFKALGFRGLIMVEVRVSDQICTMIEANPRFWGPSQLFVDAMSFDLFDAFLRDQGIDWAAPKVEGAGARYFWFEGLLSTLRDGGSVAYHGYDAQVLTDDLPAWLAADLYRRQDTYGIFWDVFKGGDL